MGFFGFGALGGTASEHLIGEKACPIPEVIIAQTRQLLALI